MAILCFSSIINICKSDTATWSDSRSDSSLHFQELSYMHDCIRYHVWVVERANFRARNTFQCASSFLAMVLPGDKQMFKHYSLAIGCFYCLYAYNIVPPTEFNTWSGQNRKDTHYKHWLDQKHTNKRNACVVSHSLVTRSNYLSQRALSKCCFDFWIILVKRKSFKPIRWRQQFALYVQCINQERQLLKAMISYINGCHYL